MKNVIERLIEKLPEEAGGVKVSAALISSGENRFYLTGFPSSAGTVLAFRDGAAYFLTDFRYAEAAGKKAKGVEVICAKKTNETIAELLKKHNAAGVILENNKLTVAQADALKTTIEEAGGKTILDTTLDKILVDLRSVKTPEEIQKIRDAQKITDAAYAHVLGMIQPGVTEREIALEIEFFMRKQGAQGVAFDLIVVSGENGSQCHGVPSEKKINKGDFITMDTGALLDGYHSDMTRTVAMGSVSDEQRHVYDLVLEGQLAAIKMAKPGVVCGDVDKVARDILEAEYKGAFEHSLGHGVGVEIHEWPNFAAGNTIVLEPNMVITVEPGIYLPGRFGVRIEDMIAITENGCEDLTHSPKELTIL